MQKKKLANNSDVKGKVKTNDSNIQRILREIEQLEQVKQQKKEKLDALEQQVVLTKFPENEFDELRQRIQERKEENEILR